MNTRRARARQQLPTLCQQGVTVRSHGAMTAGSEEEDSGPVRPVEAPEPPTAPTVPSPRDRAATPSDPRSGTLRLMAAAIGPGHICDQHPSASGRARGCRSAEEIAGSTQRLATTADHLNQLVARLTTACVGQTREQRSMPVADRLPLNWGTRWRRSVGPCGIGLPRVRSLRRRVRRPVRAPQGVRRCAVGRAPELGRGRSTRHRVCPGTSLGAVNAAGGEPRRGQPRPAGSR